MFSDYLEGAPGGSRIPNLLIRSQMLYPIELRAHDVLHYMLTAGADATRATDGRRYCKHSQKR